MNIADTAVLVTGANRGLGRALVEEAFRRGAKRIYAGARQPLAEGWRSSAVKALERQFAAYVEATPVKS